MDHLLKILTPGSYSTNWHANLTLSKANHAPNRSSLISWPSCSPAHQQNLYLPLPPSLLDYLSPIHPPAYSNNTTAVVLLLRYWSDQVILQHKSFLPGSERQRIYFNHVHKIFLIASFLHVSLSRLNSECSKNPFFFFLPEFYISKNFLVNLYEKGLFFMGLFTTQHPNKDRKIIYLRYSP